MKRVAKALIYDGVGNVLVLRRSGTHPTHAFHPDLPGGIIESHESIKEGVSREIREEVGLELSHEAFTGAPLKSLSGGFRKSLFLVQLDTVKPHITLSWEHDKYEWVGPSALVQKLSSNDKYIMAVQNYVRANVARE